MSKRHRDALAIVDPGACNPSGIALSIADACREIRAERSAGTNELCSDPALRLMIYQLAYITGVCALPSFDYNEAVEHCQQRAREKDVPRDLYGEPMPNRLKW